MPRSVANPLNTQAVQNFLPGFSPVQDALTQLAEASGEERGAVFTRREVVEFTGGTNTPGPPVWAVGTSIVAPTACQDAPGATIGTGGIP